MLNYKKNKKRILTLPQTVALGFVAIILAGAGLLCLPFATKGNGSLSFIDALFTSTSATCVTGLVVASTYDTFTVFGQVVITMLIQVGGLGFMTLSSAIYLLIGKRIGLRTQLELQRDFDEDGGRRGFVRLIRKIMLISLVCESVGALILTVAFKAHGYGFLKALGVGVFTSISAFCNAGFDLTPGGGSLAEFGGNGVVLITVMLLIVIGGIGFLVVGDVFDKGRWARLKMHTRIVLIATPVLIVTGACVFCFAEWNGVLADMTAGEKILNAFFSSVTLRTAGFSTVDFGKLSSPSYVLSVVFMFIGASPASTGGGIKTTTFVVLLLAAVATVRQKDEVVVSRREITKNTIRRAASTLFIGLLWVVVSFFVLCCIEQGRFSTQQLLFEEVSAFATVGLSTGITGALSVASKVIIILSMYVGRIGMLTFCMCFAAPPSELAKIKYKQAQISV